MIKKKKYLKALAIVLAYHKQLKDEVITLEEKETTIAYMPLKDVVSGSFVVCTFVHSNSTNNLTKGNKYEILNTDEYRFLIETDSGKKNWYYLNNNHFRALR